MDKNILAPLIVGIIIVSLFGYGLFFSKPKPSHDNDSENKENSRDN